MPSDAFPPGLSIREQQVFRLVREGRVDSEIAVRIGVGTGEVKQTVTVLMSKCGVSERSGLLAWEPGAPPATRRPWVERLADRMGATVGGLLVAAIVLGMGAIYLWRAIPDDDEPVDLSGILRTVTAGAGPEDTMTVIPNTVVRDGVRYEPLTYLDPVEFPRDTVMYVTSGCGACAVRGIPGEPPELVRVYRDRNGEVHEEVLFGSPPAPAYISGWAATWDRMVVAVCPTGACVDATALYELQDHGVTWGLLDEFEASVQPLGYFGSGEVLLAYSEPASEGSTYRWYPSGSSLTPPRGAETAHPIIGGRGLLWRAREGKVLLLPDGAVLATAVAPIIAQPPTASWTTVISLENIGPTEFRSYVRIEYPDGPRGYTGEAVYPGPFVRGQGIYATAKLPRPVTDRSVLTLPATFTPEDGVVIPIAEPFKDWSLERRESMRILAVRQMPNIARVTTDEDCVPVRAVPSPAAAQLACYADGVLVAVGEPKNVIDGITWWPIDDLVGGPGWISESNLER